MKPVYLTEYARDLRRHMTASEDVLWQALRRKSLGVRVHRQHPIPHPHGDMIADFWVPRWKLVIEVDGGYHTTPEQQFRDRLRTRRLESLGCRVIRFTDVQVFNKLLAVVAAIRACGPVTDSRPDLVAA